MARQPKAKKQTYGIDAAAIGIAKFARDPGLSLTGELERVHISGGRAYAADGFRIVSAELPATDPSDLTEDSAVSYPAADIAALDWEDFTQRPYSLVNTKDVRLGDVFRSGDLVRLAHGKPPDSKKPAPCTEAGMRAVAESQGIAGIEPATTVLSIELLGGILDALREVGNRLGGASIDGGIVLRIYPDRETVDPYAAPRVVEWLHKLPDGRTIEGMLMPMVLPFDRAIVPHWRKDSENE
jgi:hypothetical protein